MDIRRGEVKESKHFFFWRGGSFSCAFSLDETLFTPHSVRLTKQVCLILPGDNNKHKFIMLHGMVLSKVLLIVGGARCHV